MCLEKKFFAKIIHNRKFLNLCKIYKSFICKVLNIQLKSFVIYQFYRLLNYYSAALCFVTLTVIESLS